MAQGGTQGLSGWAREVLRRSEGLPRGGLSGPRALFGAHCDRLFEDASVFRPFFRQCGSQISDHPTFWDLWKGACAPNTHISYVF